MTTTTTTPETPKTKKAPHACACAGWIAQVKGEHDLKGLPKAHRDAAWYDAETDFTNIELECGKECLGVFAPGHDARFKGLAITAVRLGGDLNRDGIVADPWTAVAGVAPALLAHLPARGTAAPEATTPALPAKTQALVDAVKAHATEHYNDGGWDVLVETYDDEQIAELIGKARSPKGAIAKAASVVSVWADRQADAVNSAF